MSENKVLKAETRENLGKEGCAQIRDEKSLPAVVYGPELKDNIYISVNYGDFEKTFQVCGKHSVIELEVGKNKHKVIIKDFKFHPLSRRFMHVDFYAVSKKKPFTTEVPLNFVGTPVGVKEGGNMFVFKSKLKIRTTLDAIPSKIDVDISKLKVAQYLIVRDIPKSEAYKILTHEGNVLVEIK
jgi:large subunit ribosomal protein L25